MNHSYLDNVISITFQSETLLLLVTQFQMMKNVDLNGQLDILRIIDPSVDIEQLRKAIIKIPKNHAIDQYTFSKVHLNTINIILILCLDTALH